MVQIVYANRSGSIFFRRMKANGEEIDRLLDRIDRNGGRVLAFELED
jgi:hypothetical protein